MKINVHPNNKNIVKTGVKVSPAENNHGYYAAITAEVWGHSYTVESLKGPSPFIVLTFDDKIMHEKHVISCTNPTNESIEIDHVEVFKGGSNYGKRYAADKFLKKYAQLACMVHGLYINKALTA